jgi:hypothetical protein
LSSWEVLFWVQHFNVMLRRRIFLAMLRVFMLSEEIELSC